MSDIAVVVIIFATAIAFGFSNGFNDAANAVAASIGSRAIRPRHALMLAGVCNLAGALTGTAVAKTIGKGIIGPGLLTNEIVIGAIIAAVAWTMLASYRGLPISVSHSLVSGLVGAGLAAVGTSDIGWGKFSRTLIAVIAAPTLGFIGAFAVMVILLWVFHKFKPGYVNMLFRKGQWVTTGFLAYAHGKNDGQMPIALMTMGWVLFQGDPGIWDSIPIWIKIISALSISLGTATGGWRVIKTLGFKVTALKPIQGFTSDGASAAVIEVASQIGIPVSTTHCAVASVIGVGATTRLSAVRWGVARSIVFAWVLTFPICGLLGYGITKLLTL
ncbi:MAG: inorganic phosphate transporter [Chloroflexi bacterium]|jgi:inorganic phosphate transporter, PiT family|nr:inorganic phosphate transporter [Chloroflexota bacterium]MBT7081887.1 inorganic phosphate transporter [Chloroflexota bacterium]